MFIPLKNTVDVLVRGEPETDRFGNERPGKGVWRSVAVASWWVDRTDEKSGDSVLRTIDYLHVHFRPDDAPKPDSVIRHRMGHSGRCRETLRTITTVGTAGRRGWLWLMRRR